MFGNLSHEKHGHIHFMFVHCITTVHASCYVCGDGSKNMEWWEQFIPTHSLKRTFRSKLKRIMMPAWKCDKTNDIIPWTFLSTGTCQLYHKENETCSGFEHINGYCGCGPGLECYMYEVPIEGVQVAPGRRSMVAPRPGYNWHSECWSLDRIPQA